ncbi:hypothetical protein MP228_010946 [Amoeboaphelidium protococcarum]|nr:hypothetical protein MP228_010946 [Amoeboaphelidium protococcarum]
MMNFRIAQRLFAAKAPKPDLLQELYIKELKNVKPAQKFADEVPEGVDALKSLLRSSSGAPKAPSAGQKQKK